MKKSVLAAVILVALSVTGCGMFTAPYFIGIPTGNGSGYQGDPTDSGTGGGIPPIPPPDYKPPRAG